MPLRRVDNQSIDDEDVVESVPNAEILNVSDVLPVVGITVEEIESETRRSLETTEVYLNETVVNSWLDENDFVTDSDIESDTLTDSDLEHNGGKPRAESDSSLERNTKILEQSECVEDRIQVDGTPCSGRRRMVQDAHERLRASDGDEIR